MESSARFTPAAGTAFAFLFGPAALAIAIAYYVAAYPPAFAHPSQAAALQLSLLAPILFLGAAGVFLSIASGMTPNPLSGESARGQLRAALVSGLLLGVVATAVDHTSGFSKVVANHLSVDSIHIAFPASLYVYTAGAIAVECLYRFIPVAFLYALIARVTLGGRGEAFVFWTLGVLSSLLEPLSQTPLAGSEPNLVWALFALIFIFNLSEIALWRRYGWVAPLVARLVFYYVWHVALGPLVSGTLAG
jgi:hypothetical protein